ncbi:hypothetical protein BV22DRAFT_1047291 [Leucogyrophana mollusca]|uniref:Uncharacterized protein n=1 Tax=Leucogyrophana mollusca TaxID=85980 RepID=A0ACB8BIT7_9AGAM|nr:hypothetical protein BV22DRAFT_1047291 [Leucogyrophana mollusca]
MPFHSNFLALFTPSGNKQSPKHFMFDGKLILPANATVSPPFGPNGNKAKALHISPRSSPDASQLCSSFSKAARLTEKRQHRSILDLDLPSNPSLDHHPTLFDTGSSHTTLGVLRAYPTALEAKCQSENDLVKRRVKRCRLEGQLFKGQLAGCKKRPSLPDFGLEILINANDEDDSFNSGGDSNSNSYSSTNSSLDECHTPEDSSEEVFSGSLGVISTGKEERGDGHLAISDLFQRLSLLLEPLALMSALSVVIMAEGLLRTQLVDARTAMLLLRGFSSVVTGRSHCSRGYYPTTLNSKGTRPYGIQDHNNIMTPTSKFQATGLAIKALKLSRVRHDHGTWVIPMKEGTFTPQHITSNLPGGPPTSTSPTACLCAMLTPGQEVILKQWKIPVCSPGHYHPAINAYQMGRLGGPSFLTLNQGQTGDAGGPGGPAYHEPVQNIQGSSTVSHPLQQVGANCRYAPYPCYKGATSLKYQWNTAVDDVNKFLSLSHGDGRAPKRGKKHKEPTADSTKLISYDMAARRWLAVQTQSHAWFRVLSLAWRYILGHTFFEQPDITDATLKALAEKTVLWSTNKVQQTEHIVCADVDSTFKNEQHRLSATLEFLVDTITCVKDFLHTLLSSAIADLIVSHSDEVVDQPPSYFNSKRDSKEVSKEVHQQLCWDPYISYAHWHEYICVTARKQDINTPRSNSASSGRSASPSD